MLSWELLDSISPPLGRPAFGTALVGVTTLHFYQPPSRTLVLVPGVLYSGSSTEHCIVVYLILRKGPSCK